MTPDADHTLNYISYEGTTIGEFATEPLAILDSVWDGGMVETPSLYGGNYLAYTGEEVVMIVETDGLYPNNIVSIANATQEGGWTYWRAGADGYNYYYTFFHINSDAAGLENAITYSFDDGALTGTLGALDVSTGSLYLDSIEDSNGDELPDDGDGDFTAQADDEISVEIAVPAGASGDVTIANASRVSDWAYDGDAGYGYDYYYAYFDLDDDATGEANIIDYTIDGGGGGTLGYVDVAVPEIDYLTVVGDSSILAGTNPGDAAAYFTLPPQGLLLVEAQSGDVGPGDLIVANATNTAYDPDDAYTYPDDGHYVDGNGNYWTDGGDYWWTEFDINTGANGHENPVTYGSLFNASYITGTITRKIAGDSTYANVSATIPNNVVSIGEQINLSMNSTITSGASFQWDLPGTVFGNFTVGPSPTYTLYYNNLTTSTGGLSVLATNTQNITYYWVSGGNYTVQGNVTLGDNVYPLYASIIALTPSIPPFAVTSPSGNATIVNPSDDGGIALSYGADYPHNGIYFQCNPTNPSGYSNGNISWVQTINNITLQHEENDNSWWIDQITSGNLDGPWHFGVANLAFDSPSLDLNTTGNTSDWKMATLSGNFTIWLTYNPGTSNAIFVPIQNATWSWSGNATFTSGNWTLTGNATPPNTTASSNTGNGTATTTPPIWNSDLPSPRTPVWTRE